MAARRARAAVAVAVLMGVAVSALARVVLAAEPAPVATPDAGAPPDGAAAEPVRAVSQAAAAQRATQDLETRVIELRRDLDGLERQRVSFDDLRRRLDDLEARQAALARGPDDAWMSAQRGGDDIRFSRNGFVIRSPTGRFLLRPGLRLQSVYEGRLAAAGLGDPARTDASSFALTHAELLFEGHAVTRRLEFRFELDFAETGPQTGDGAWNVAAPFIVKDAFVQWRLLRAVAVRAGHVKVPFGMQSQLWNGYLEFVDVSQATAAFRLDRDFGLVVVGRPLAGRLQYHVAAINGPRGGACPGAVEGLACDRIDLAYAARIVAAPFGSLPVSEGDGAGHPYPLLAVGISGAYALRPTDIRARSGAVAAPLDIDQDGRVDNVATFHAAAELRAVYRGAALQAEWFGRRDHPGAELPDRNYWGAYGQASYFVLPRRLQIAARFGRTDLPLYGATTAERAARGTHVTEEAVAVSAYLSGHEAKLQVDYTHFAAPDALSAPRVDRIRAAVQLAF